MNEKYEVKQFVEKIILDHKINIPISEQISEMGFSYFMYPYLYSQAKILVSSIDKNNYDMSNIDKIVLRNIPRYFYLMIAKILVLELNIERLKNNLTGDTSELRLQSYFKKLKNKDYLLYIFNEFPNLLPLIKNFIKDWKNSTQEFLANLDNDIVHIKSSLLSNVKVVQVIQIDWGKGDRHQGGKSVCIVTFSNGKKVVYKPRTFSTDIIVRDITEWINNKISSNYLYQVKFIDKKTHGWSEFIEHKQLNNNIEINIFYEKLGALLALLYVLQATDMHYENIIAYDSYPVIIDTETLFQVNLKYEGTLPTTYFDTNKTVLKSNIIPAFVDELFDKFDSSAINTDKSVELPINWTNLKNAGRDDMTFVEIPSIFDKSVTNLPKNIDKKELLDFLPSLLHGFKQLYFLIYDNKSEFIDLISKFKNVSRRLLFRNTFQYDKLIESSYHTDLMSKEGEREKFLISLNDASLYPELKGILKSEIDSVLNGEVPMFYGFIENKDAYYQGKIIGIDLYEQTGFELVKNVIASLSKEHYKLQNWIIETTLKIKSNSKYQEKRADISRCDLSLNENHILKVCNNLGERILEYKFNENDNINWLNVNFSSELPKIQLMDCSIYSGLSGMLLFYTYLAKVTNDVVFINTSKEIYYTILKRAKEEKITQIGAFTGLGGILYSVIHYQQIFKQGRDYTIVSDFIDILYEKIEKDDKFDIIYGVAGVILVALAVYKSIKLEKSLQLAEKCAYHLINNANKQDIGTSWADNKLTGFSHGTSGIIYSFVELYKVTSNQDFLDIALKALEYENSTFSKTAQNWTDLRKFNSNNKEHSTLFSNSWCNGTNGIGISRLNLASVINKDTISKDIEIALNINKLESFGENHCLCHGDLGNLELLIKANSSKENEGVINNVVNRILSDFENSNYRYGNQLNIETFDLMTGKAGFAYQLLRIAYPKVVPSVLILEPPK